MRKVVGEWMLSHKWDVEPQVGWWTGWVEQPNGKVTAFSLNMEMNKTEHVEARKTIVYEALQQLGLIQH